MAMTTLSITVDSDIVKTEGPNRISRDEVTVASGNGVLACGTVIEQIAVGAATVAPKGGGNTGNGVFTLDGTTPVEAGAKNGGYKVTCITAAANGGTFRVSDPDGFVLGDVAVGATFDNDIKFAIADGSSDFVVGDSFTVTVAAGSGKFAPLGLTGPNTTQLRILLQQTDTTAGDVIAVALARQAEVVANALAWPVGITTPQKTAALAALDARGIVARVGV